MIPREARPVRVPAHVQKLRERRRADAVERTTVMTRKLSGEIHLCLRHRSHPVMTGNSTVREDVLLIAQILTVPSTDAVASAIPNPGQEALRPGEGEQNTVDDDKSGWKSTASATAKLLLRGVRDSADAFGPLKSVAGGLCFILENCEVRSPPTCTV